MQIESVIGVAEGVNKLTSMNALVLHSGTLFITDTYVQVSPEAEDIAEIVALCSEEVRWFGIEPKVALLSNSNFGSHDSASANIAFNLLKVLGDGIAIGPILVGTAKSAHVVTPSISVRGLLKYDGFGCCQGR